MRQGPSQREAQEACVRQREGDGTHVLAIRVLKVQKLHLAVCFQGSKEVPVLPIHLQPPPFRSTSRENKFMGSVLHNLPATPSHGRLG